MVGIPTIYGDEWGMVSYCYTHIKDETATHVLGWKPDEIFPCQGAQASLARRMGQTIAVAVSIGNDVNHG